MATLVSDPASGSFNCYISLADADVYHEKRLHNTAWTSATDDDKEAALMWATRQLDTLAWKGVRALGTQPLQFPRKGLSYWEYDDETGDYEIQDVSNLGLSTYVEVPNDAPPREVKDATAELAFTLISGDTTASTGTEGFKRIKVDTIELEMDAKDRLRWLQDATKNLCWRFLKSGGSSVNVPTKRVG